MMELYIGFIKTNKPNRLIYSASKAVKTCRMDLYYEPIDQMIRRMGRRKA